MTITVENIPYLSLVWIGLGFGILILGIFMVAYHQADPKEYTQKLEGKEDNKIQELFSFFLQEQEEKNDVLRNTVLNAAQNAQTKNQVITKQYAKQKMLIQEPKKTNQVFEKITALHEAGNSPEEIARCLKMGIGEVQLILSLYTMR